MILLTQQNNILTLDKLKYNLTAKDLYRTAIMASLWSFIEITFGTWLHITKLPFRGLILSIVAAILLVFAKKILPYKGSLLLIAVITVSIKSTLTGVFILNPIIAMIMESIFAEFFFSVLKPNLIGSIISGMAVLFYTFTHSIIAQIFFFGFDIINVYVSILGKFINIHSDKQTFAILLLTCYLFIHLILGAIAGWLGFKIATKTLIIINVQDENF